jgi:hypothetical protein
MAMGKVMDLLDGGYKDIWMILELLSQPAGSRLHRANVKKHILKKRHIVPPNVGITSSSLTSIGQVPPCSDPEPGPEGDQAFSSDL